MIRLKNIAPDYNNSARFVRADLPFTVIADGWAPRASLILPDGTEGLVISRDTTVAVVSTRDWTVKPESTVSIPSEPKYIFSIGSQIMVMTAVGRHIFNIDSAGALVAAADPCRIPSDIWLRSVSASPAVVNMPATALSKSYESGRQLEPADRLRAASHAADLYMALDRAAKSAGSFCRPAVGAVRFCRADGSVAFTSAPVLLTLPEASVNELGRSLLLTARDGKYIGEAAVTAPAWQLHVHFPEIDMPEITSAQVILSPLLHAALLYPDSAVVSDTGTSDGAFCRVTFPLGSAESLGIGQCAATLAATLNVFGQTVATVANPFDGYDETLAIFSLNGANEDERLLKAALSEASSIRRNDSLARILSPNSFTASAVGKSGSAVCWGGIQALPFSGYDPLSLVAVAADAPLEVWRAYVAVTLDDGSRLVRSGAGIGSVPVGISPLLSYPSPHAVLMEIGIDEGGTFRKGVFSLSPDSTGSLAFFAHSSAKPFRLDLAQSFAVPASKFVPVALTGILAAAPAESPLAVSAVAKVAGSGAICAVMPSKFSSSAWDFGRSRFLLFSSAGILSATVDKSHSSIALGEVDPRGSFGSGVVAVRTPLGVCALVGDDVVLIDGGRVSTVACGVKADSLAFDRSRHELWCISAGAAEALVLCPRKDWYQYTCSLPASATDAVCGSWVGTATGICDVEHGARADRLDVECVREMSYLGCSHHGVSLNCVTVHMRGTVGSAGQPFRVDLSRSYLGLQKARVATMRLNGEVRAPLRLPILFPSRISLPAVHAAAGPLTLSLSGPAASDFSITIN